MKTFSVALAIFAAWSSVQLHAYSVSLVTKQEHTMKFEYSPDKGKYRQTSNVSFLTHEGINQEGNKDKKESVDEDVVGINRTGHSLATLYQEGDEIFLMLELDDTDFSFSYTVKIPINITKGSWADFDSGKPTEFVTAKSGRSAYEKAFDKDISPMVASIFNSRLRNQLIQKEPDIERYDLKLDIKTTVGNFSFMNLEDAELGGIHVIAHKNQLEISISPGKYSTETKVHVTAPERVVF